MPNRLDHQNPLSRVRPVGQQGEVFIPSLGRSFQPSELKTVALEFSKAAFQRGSVNFHNHGGSGPLDTSFRGRLIQGEEMALSTLLLLGSAVSNEGDIRLRFNRKVIFYGSPALLRAHSVAHTTPEAFHKFTDTIKDISLLESVQDMLIGLQALINQKMSGPVLGYHFHVPAQLKDVDDIDVDGLPEGNSLYLMGIIKSPAS